MLARDFSGKDEHDGMPDFFTIAKARASGNEDASTDRSNSSRVCEKSRQSGLTVFDLDHTLFRVNASFEFGRYLYRCGVISFSQAIFCCYFYFLHKFFGLNSSSLHHKIFQSLFLGKSKTLLSSLVCDFLEENWDAFVAPKIMSFLEEEKRLKWQVVLLSNSPQFLIDEIGKRFGLSIAIGTEYQVNQANIFCSLGEIMDGSKKKEVVARIIQKENMEPSAVKVYTDSLKDYPLLAFAGEAVCVNPGWRLRRYCHKKGWKVFQCSQ